MIEWIQIRERLKTSGYLPPCLIFLCSAPTPGLRPIRQAVNYPFWTELPPSNHIWGFQVNIWYFMSAAFVVFVKWNDQYSRAINGYSFIVFQILLTCHRCAVSLSLRSVSPGIHSRRRRRALCFSSIDRLLCSRLICCNVAAFRLLEIAPFGFTIITQKKLENINNNIIYYWNKKTQLQ